MMRPTDAELPPVSDAGSFPLPPVPPTPPPSRAQRTAQQLVEQVRGLLSDPANRFPPVEEVIRVVGVSSRTLRRKLARAGTSFLALRDAARRAHAMALLEGSKLTVERIASELGYSESAGFVRAFHRWMGESPGSYRRRVTHPM